MSEQQDFTKGLSDYLDAQEPWLKKLIPKVLNEYVGFSTTNKQKGDKDKIKEIEDLILKGVKKDVRR